MRNKNATPRHRAHLLLAALLLSACASPAANPPAPPPAAAPIQNAPTQQPAAQRPTAAPVEPTAPPVSAVPSAIPTVPADTLVPTAAPLMEVGGETLLNLGVGNGPDQVGVKPEAVFPTQNALRIAGNGEIRVLDPINNRLLVFSADGKPLRQQRFPELEYPVDFIIAPSGETYVLGRPLKSDNYRNVVLRYAPDGKLAEQIDLGAGPGNSANGISLTAADDLLLTLDSWEFWVIRRKGQLVPPDLQHLTEREGTGTPRSPLLFNTVTLEKTAGVRLDVISFSASATRDMVGSVTNVEIGLPTDARFLNVDRGMNLYFAQMVTANDQQTSVAVWRVAPDGTVVGGARFTAACGLMSRQLYVDQEGAAWTLCPTGQGAVVQRYQLRGADGQPLPVPPPTADDVIWSPGRRLDAT